MKKELIISAIITVVLIIGTILWNQSSMKNSSLQSNTTPTSVMKSNTAATKANLTITEVAKHDSASDCWIIINNNVYNVTTYISTHPGGSVEVIKTCGTDATVAYDAIKGGRGHSPNADTDLSSLFIGAVQ